MHYLLDAKVQYKYLYLIKTEEYYVIFKGLLWREYKAIRDLMVSMPRLTEDIKDHIVKSCLIEFKSELGSYRYDLEITRELIMLGWVNLDMLYDNIDAGIIDMVFDSILFVSGANNQDKLMYDIESARYYSEIDAEKRLLSMTSRVYNYKFRDYDNEYWEDIVNVISQGELMHAGQLLNTPYQTTKNDTPNIETDDDI